MKSNGWYGLGVGMVTAMVLLSGCSSKNRRLAPVSGENGLLGSRAIIPAPMASPAEMKLLPQSVRGENAEGAPGAEVKEPVLAVPGGAAPLPGAIPAEPVLADDSAFGAGRLAPVVQPSTLLKSEPNGAAPLPGYVPPASDAPAETAVPGAIENLSAAPAPAAESTLRYTVQRGDTLSSIARSYGVKWQDIATLNHITAESTLKVGQELKMPAGAVAPVAPKAAAVSKPQAVPAQSADKAKSTGKGKARAHRPLPKDGKYTVRGGDSLWIIARRYGLDHNKLKEINKLSTDTLRIGQVLILTGAESKASTAKAGKSPAKAAAKPAKTTSQSKPATASANQVAGLSSDKHVVVSGDNLWTLARRYKVKIDDLREWNNLKSDNLSLGQVLIIRRQAGATPSPAATTEAAAPVVPEKQNTSVVNLQQTEAQKTDDGLNAVLNAVSDTQGEEAAPQAPASASTLGEVQTITVASGETVNSLLRRTGMQLEQFKQLNPGIDLQQELVPGTQLKIYYLGE